MTKDTSGKINLCKILSLRILEAELRSKSDVIAIVHAILGRVVTTRNDAKDLVHMVMVAVYTKLLFLLTLMMIAHLFVNPKSPWPRWIHLIH